MKTMTIREKINSYFEINIVLKVFGSDRSIMNEFPRVKNLAAGLGIQDFDIDMTNSQTVRNKRAMIIPVKSRDAANKIRDFINNQVTGLTATVGI